VPGAIRWGTPVLVGSTQTLVSSVTGATVYSQESASTPVLTTSTIIGPASVIYGDVSNCGGAYAALPSTTKPVCASNPQTFSSTET
jgi:hypothetical protein